jgi:hypothetical protein
MQEPEIWRNSNSRTWHEDASVKKSVWNKRAVVPVRNLHERSTNPKHISFADQHGMGLTEERHYVTGRRMRQYVPASRSHEHTPQSVDRHVTEMRRIHDMLHANDLRPVMPWSMHAELRRMHDLSGNDFYIHWENFRTAYLELYGSNSWVYIALGLWSTSKVLPTLQFQHEACSDSLWYQSPSNYESWQSRGKCFDDALTSARRLGEQKLAAFDAYRTLNEDFAQYMVESWAWWVVGRLAAKVRTFREHSADRNVQPTPPKPSRFKIVHSNQDMNDSD